MHLLEDGDTVVAFSKELDDPAIDCGAFLLPVEVFDAQRRVAARGDGSLAGVVTELAATTPLAAVPLPSGTRWQDVDTPEDLRRVSKLLRAWLTKGADGPVSRYVNRPVSSRISMGHRAPADLPRRRERPRVRDRRRRGGRARSGRRDRSAASSCIWRRCSTASTARSRG